MYRLCSSVLSSKITNDVSLRKFGRTQFSNLFSSALWASVRKAFIIFLHGKCPRSFSSILWILVHEIFSSLESFRAETLSFPFIRFETFLMAAGVRLMCGWPGGWLTSIETVWSIVLHNRSTVLKQNPSLESQKILVRSSSLPFYSFEQISFGRDNWKIIKRTFVLGHPIIRNSKAWIKFLRLTCICMRGFIIGRWYQYQHK